MAINFKNWYWAMGSFCLVGLLLNNSALFGTLKLVVVARWRLSHRLQQVDKIRLYILKPNVR